jgi:hypothetical protein
MYETFAPVPRPVKIEYCPCCFTPAEEQALLTPAPLRRLPAGALEPYASHAMMTVGGPADFRYFLPRLLEVGCARGFAWPDLEVLLGHLRRAEWLRWAGEERAAVRDFLHALWSQTLAERPGAAESDTVLCAIGNAEDDLTPYLEEWRNRLAEPAAATQLHHLLSMGRRTRRGTTWLANAFWQERAAQAGQVLAWLTGDDLRQAVTEAFDAADAEPALQTLADVEGLL